MLPDVHPPLARTKACSVVVYAKPRQIHSGRGEMSNTQGGDGASDTSICCPLFVVVGGQHDYKTIQPLDVSVYDMESKQWRQVEMDKQLTGRYGVSAVVLPNKKSMVLLLGGMSDEQEEAATQHIHSCISTQVYIMKFET